MNKICLRCKEEKNLNDFHNYKSAKDGKRDWCKLCISKYMKNLKIERNKIRNKFDIKKEKTCKLCKKTKAIDNFSIHISNKYGRNNFCKECIAIKSKDYRSSELYKKINKESVKKYDKKNKHKRKKYREENKEKVKQYHKKYRSENIKKITEYHKEYRKKNKEIIKIKTKKYEIENTEKIKIRKKKYRIENKDKIYHRLKKYKQQPEIKIKKKIRDNFISSFKRQMVNKTNLFFSYTEISYDEYISHLKNSEYWLDFYNNKNIHIDHIIPCSAYDFNNDEEIKRCWQPENLRLIPAKENLSKNDRIDFELIKQYKIEYLLPESLICKSN